MVRKDGLGLRIFFEVQGYLDPKIYWRLFRQITSYYEQNEDSGPFLAIVLFLSPAYDPEPPDVFRYLEETELPILQRYNLKPCLQALKEQSGELTVLNPLITKNEKELKDKIETWQMEIKSLPLPQERLKLLFDLLVYAIAQRFPKLSLKELKAMLSLTPLEESVAFQELIEEKVYARHKKLIERNKKLEERTEKLNERTEKLNEQTKKLEESRDKGAFIGGIRASQRLLGLTIQSDEELEKLSVSKLRSILKDLVKG